MESTTKTHPLKIGDTVWSSGIIYTVTAVLSSPKGQLLAILDDKEQEIIVDTENDLVVLVDEEMETILDELETLDEAGEKLFEKVKRKHHQLVHGKDGGEATIA